MTKITTGKSATEKNLDRKKTVTMAGQEDEQDSQIGSPVVALNSSMVRGTSVAGGVGEACLHLDLSRAAARGNRP